MSRQDQIVDDDEPETCPLCIEELDLSDRGFRPCPCGYQICQFCYNHLKTQLNSLCPACRRPYDDKNIKFDAPSAEEVAKYKENKAQQDKRKAATRRQEAATRHADTLSRKHLAGIRVRRQNLVYVTGLRLNTSDPQLSEKLRGEQYFGQYGKIDKIVVNKPKDSRSLQPVGVYITYFEREAAALCIELVNGTQNAGGLIRADYGTTKYCSAFLRNEICSNKNCTFLHEVGEDNESFTREGLSSLNAISSQSTHSQAPTQAPPTQARPPPLQPPQPQPVATSRLMERQDSGHEASSPVDSSDGSALPSTASWAKEPLSRRHSQSQSFASASPVISNANPMPAVTESPAQESRQRSEESSQQSSVQMSLPRKASRPVDTDIQRLQKLFASDTFPYVFDDSGLSFQEKELMKNMPLLFDPCGGARRLAARNREAERRRQENDRQVASQALSSMDIEDGTGGGSLQLGGEPEERHDLELTQSQQRGAVTSSMSGLERELSASSQSHGLDSRSPLPQQQQQYLAQQFKSNSPSLLGPGQRPQGDFYAPNAGLAHSRQTSRFSFANDTASATTSLKPVTSAKLMNQQSSMMPPPPQGNQYNPLSQQNQGGTQLFSSGVQGPPPGLKASGTPPVSGGGMFGQGHGFATAGLGYSVNSTSRNTNDEMMRELMRNRGSSAGSGQTPEGGRREYTFSHFSHRNPSPAPLPGFSSFPYGSYPGAFQDLGPQKQRKKKKKKQRHANTSSFGGGAVDLADPSILQARMHQATSTGQGHYGAQGQGQGYPVFPGTTRTSNQDDLGVGAFKVWPLTTSWSYTGQGRGFSQFLSPGLPANSRQVMRQPSEQLFGGGPPLSSEEPLLMPGLGVLSSPMPPALTQTEPAKATITLREPNASLQMPISEVNSRAVPGPRVHEDTSFPALPKATLPRFATDTKGKGQNNEVRKREPIKGNEHGSSHRIPIDTTSLKQSKQHLDITATAGSNAIPVPDTDPATIVVSSKPETPSHADVELNTTPSTSSRPATPGQFSDTPLKCSTQPRTIRVLPVSKAETPAIPSAASTPPLSQPRRRSPSVGGKHASRQPSIASINAPGTPLSEKIPDNASVTTDSVSRASSPYPMVKESAPGKTKSRTQLKKEKAERAKSAAEEKKMPEKEATPLDEAAIHEPVIGRKKKSKKPAAPATSTPTPELSRPSSPINQIGQPEIAEESEQQEVLPSAPAPTRLTREPELPNEQSQPILDPEAEPKPSKPSRSLPAFTISELESTGDLDPARIEFFKASISLFNARQDITAADLLNTKTPPPLTSAELQALQAGEPVHRVGDDHRTSSRLLITPSRTCLPRLTAELEDRYLRLEKAIMTSKRPFRYIHRYKEVTPISITADEMLKDMCAALTRPATTTSAAGTSPTHTAAGYNLPSPGSTTPDDAIYEDDAFADLDQFNLPPLSPRSEPSTRTTTSHSPPADKTATTDLEDDAAPRSLPAWSRSLSVSSENPTTASLLNSLGQRTLPSFAAPHARKEATRRAADEIPAIASSAITQPLAHAVNGVVNAAAAVTGATNLGPLGASSTTAAGGGGAGGGLGQVVSLEEAEQALNSGKKEAEMLAKKMAGLVRRNRKVAGLQ